ncbi:hypothetical protein WJX75_004761 [Coccomyxa subellipsoidea]|uniref:Uncharacterized protein n=1 Tax=Coccomyxa subellipsoidea TaxID=248742 RepID=A0ABR2YJI6_9CHLO
MSWLPRRISFKVDPWERGKAQPVCLAAAKGFGKTSQKEQAPTAKRKHKKGADLALDGSSSKAVERAVRAVEGRKVRPVDPREASKGRLDYAQVSDWGSGEPADLDALQVTSFEADSGPERPFYEQLARRLAQLERQGALRVAQPRGAEPLPPFHKWSFREMRYIQWLVDMHTVHYALEAALADAVTVAATEHYGVSESLGRVFKALECFAEERGLDRSLEIAADLNNIAKASTLSEPVELSPSPNAQTYADYLCRLGLLCTEEDEATEIEEAALRLVANAYLVHVTHLTTGMRIGAAAAEKLDLFPAQALNYFQTWPDGVLPDPLALCVANVNAAGDALSPEQREAVMQELPKAMPKISLLLTPLAHTK